jgi:hypothetical protein
VLNIASGISTISGNPTIYNTKPQSIVIPRQTMFFFTPFCLYILFLSCITTHALIPPGTRKECVEYCQRLNDGAYQTILQMNGVAPLSAWCSYWSLECACIGMDCPDFDIKCDYLDTSIVSDGSSCSVRESDSGACVLTPPFHTFSIF